jgi:hypothetical protein
MEAEMADWTNYPAGTNPPANNVNLSSPQWVAHIKEIKDTINPDGIVPMQVTKTIEGPFDVIVGGSSSDDGTDPTAWKLEGNRKKGKFDFNLWTRQYKSLRVQTYMRVTLIYYTVQSVGRQEVAREVFYITQGGENKYKDATVYIWKLSSYTQEGKFIKLSPKLDISVKDIGLGSIEIEGLKWELSPGEDTKIDTPPPPDAKPPANATHGDAAKELEKRLESRAPSFPGLLTAPGADGMVGSTFFNLIVASLAPPETAASLETEAETAGGLYGELVLDNSDIQPSTGPVISVTQFDLLFDDVRFDPRAAEATGELLRQILENARNAPQNVTHTGAFRNQEGQNATDLHITFDTEGVAVVPTGARGEFPNSETDAQDPKQINLSGGTVLGGLTESFVRAKFQKASGDFKIVSWYWTTIDSETGEHRRLGNVKQGRPSKDDGSGDWG